MSNFVSPKALMGASIWCIVGLVMAGAAISPAEAQVLQIFEETGESPGDDESDAAADAETGDEEVEASDGATGDQSEDSDDEAPAIVISDGSAAAGGGRSMRLNYERQGNSILVPARVGTQDVYFLFDTGATYTTLTASVARQAGVMPDADAPSTVMQTAGGVTQSQFGLMDRFRLSRSRLESVTFTICDACGMGRYQGKPIAGLLGLNVLRRYRVSVDDSRGVVEMEPHSGFSDRSADIRPWLQARLSAVEAEAVVFEVRNRSDQRIDRARLSVTCQAVTGQSVDDSATVRHLGAGQSRTVRLAAALGTCRQFDADVTDGRW